MEQHTLRKTFKYQLMPTPEQERALERVVWRCRERSNVGLQARKAAWDKCRICVFVTFAMQSAQLPGIKEVRPEYRALNAQVMQAVLHRLEQACHACFRRLNEGETPGSPRLQGRNRSRRCTSAHVGAHGGAMLDGGALSRSTSGRTGVSASDGLVPLWARPRRSRSPKQPLAGTRASRGRRCRLSRCP